MIFDVDKNKTCAFSGPRTAKIDGNKEEIYNLLYQNILQAINDGYKYFISGMCDGIDLMCADIVLNLQREYNVFLICVIPFLEQEANYTQEDRELYQYFVSRARYTICLSEQYTPLVYDKRNKFMVDSCSRLIVYYNNSGGGTKSTIDYAKKTGIEIYNVLDTQLTLNI